VLEARNAPACLFWWRAVRVIVLRKSGGGHFTAWPLLLALFGTAAASSDSATRRLGVGRLAALAGAAARRLLYVLRVLTACCWRRLRPFSGTAENRIASPWR